VAIGAEPMVAMFEFGQYTCVESMPIN
jgi:hypothetical protein